MLEKTQPRFEENRKIGIFTRILESVKSNIREILTNHGDTYMK